MSDKRHKKRPKQAAFILFDKEINFEALTE